MDDDPYRPLGLGEERDGIVYVPPSAGPGAPLMLLFHGFGGTGRREIVAVREAADRHGVVVVAPDSRKQTWDVIVSGKFGPDVEFVDRVMTTVPSTYDVDPTQLAVAGISDGASYALCVGPRNDCTTIAFSPGFAFPGEQPARPRVFMSHGTRDPVLPFEHTQRIAANFTRAGYPLTFHVFDGGHTVPPEVADLAFRWWITPDESGRPKRAQRA
jgi:phospholipase/carboxylesterase